MHALKNAKGVFLLSTVALLAACGQSAAPPAAGATQGPPPAQVGVVTVTRGTVGLQTELPGRTEASRVAQVRARVAGILQHQLFREGSEVKAGQQLFQIDAAPYKATLASTQAALAKAEASLTQAKAQADRYKRLAEANAISQQDLVSAVAAQKLAEGDAKGFLSVYNSYAKAKDVTAWRLYMESTDELLKKATRVIVDTTGKGSSSVMPYMNLGDKPAPKEAAK